MKKFVTYIFIMTLLSCNVKYVNKHEVQLADLSRLEQYFQCKCIKAYQEDNHLYLKITNSPLMNSIEKWGDSTFLHHISVVSLLISNSVRNTNIDTFHIEVARKLLLAETSYSLSGTVSDYVDIADKIEVASAYCKAVSKGDFEEAKQYFNPGYTKEYSDGRIDTFLREFQSFGEVTNVSLLKYMHNDTSNFLGVVFIITFDSTKHGKFGFSFPLNGPKHIDAVSLLKD